MIVGCDMGCDMGCEFLATSAEESSIPYNNEVNALIPPKTASLCLIVMPYRYALSLCRIVVLYRYALSLCLIVIVQIAFFYYRHSGSIFGPVIATPLAIICRCS